MDPALNQDVRRYRLLRSYFRQTAQWRDFDPFFSQKQETFRGSGKAIYRSSSFP